MFRSVVKLTTSGSAALRQASSANSSLKFYRNLSLLSTSRFTDASRLDMKSRRNFSSESLEKDFQKAVANLQKVSDVDNDAKLKLYALYKQATNGPCNVEKPSLFDVVAKAKFQAWKTLGDMTPDEARQTYIATVEEMLGKSGDGSKKITAEEPSLVFEEKDSVYWIRLNRPKQYNAMTPEMYEGIIDALKRAAEDPDIKFVAIRGTGKYFSSGNDLKNFTKGIQKHGGDMEAAVSEAGEMLYRFVSAFIDFPKPIIGVANGPVFGILFTTMAMYDVVFASEKAVFTCPFTKIGQTPEGTSTYHFPRIFGPSLASQLLYFNYVMPAKEAQQRGFVHKILPEDELDKYVDKFLYGEEGAAKQCYPMALSNAKGLVMNEEHRMMLHQVNKTECDILMQQWKSEELVDALSKFMSRKG